MRLLKTAAVLAALCAFLPAAARAADTWVLQFGGPQSAEFVISDLGGTPYVSSFWVPALWAYGKVPGAVAPGWTGTLPDTPANAGALAFLSDVTFSSTGGSIRIGPSMEYIGYYDGEINLTLDYTLSAPQPVGSAFIDNAISGNFAYSYYVNASYLGPPYEDFSGSGGGSFTSLKAGIPEPATWAMLIGGLFAIGFALRMRRVRGLEGAAA